MKRLQQRQQLSSGRRRAGAGRAMAGFTLVEVLVALFAMALLAALSWQGLDGVLRSRDAGQQAIDRGMRLNTVLAQWDQDLQALHDSGAVPPLSFDGQTLRLTRRSDEGVLLVVWALRSGLGGGSLQRWVSPPYTTVQALQETWLRSQQFQGNEAGQLTVAERASEWQLYFHRGGAWSNAQSSADMAALPSGQAPLPVLPAAAAAAGAASAASAVALGASATPAANAPAAPPVALQQQELLPAAVRLLLTLDGQKLTRDIALGPTE